MLSPADCYHGPAGASHLQPGAFHDEQELPLRPWLLNLLRVLANSLKLRTWMAKKKDENIFNPAYGFGKRSGGVTAASEVGYQ